jgi:hypothetical protein
MSGIYTVVVLYSLPLSNQGRKRPCGPVGVPADTRISSLFRRLAWDGQDRRSATSR